MWGCPFLGKARQTITVPRLMVERYDLERNLSLVDNIISGNLRIFSWFTSVQIWKRTERINFECGMCCVLNKLNGTNASSSCIWSPHFFLHSRSNNLFTRDIFLLRPLSLLEKSWKIKGMKSFSGIFTGHLGFAKDMTWLFDSGNSKRKLIRKLIFLMFTISYISLMVSLENLVIHQLNQGSLRTVG